MKTDAETRARLLSTAQRLFGERGFKAVTVRDICSAAKANVAAAREAGQGRSPEDQLRVFVHVFMHRALSGGHAVHRLIAREMNDPTPALDVLVEQGLRPRIEYLSGVIAELIDCDARDPRVLRCVASVQSQVVAYFPNPIAIRLGMRFDPTSAQIDAAARHIAAFSVAGVRAVGSVPTLDATAHSRARRLRP